MPSYLNSTSQQLSHFATEQAGAIQIVNKVEFVPGIDLGRQNSFIQNYGAFHSDVFSGTIQFCFIYDSARVLYTLFINSGQDRVL